METYREFWKHTVLGDIIAVELSCDADRGGVDVLAARYCSRGEELTAGALPVLPLQTTGEAFDLATGSPGEFEVWEPPPTPEMLRIEIVKAIDERDAIASECTLMRAAERARQKDLEKAEEEVRRLCRRLKEDPASRPPLLAVAEGLPPPRPHDADDEGRPDVDSD